MNNCWPQITMFALATVRNHPAPWTRECADALTDAINDLCHAVLQKTAGQKPVTSGRKYREHDLSVADNYDHIRYQILTLAAQFAYSGAFCDAQNGELPDKERWPWIWEMMRGDNLFRLAPEPHELDDYALYALKDGVDALLQGWDEKLAMNLLVQASWIVMLGGLQNETQV